MAYYNLFININLKLYVQKKSKTNEIYDTTFSYVVYLVYLKESDKILSLKIFILLYYLNILLLICFYILFFMIFFC